MRRGALIPGPHIDDDEDEAFLTFGVGTASLSYFGREVSVADRRRWKKEDAERDARRVPLGFCPPEQP